MVMENKKREILKKNNKLKGTKQARGQLSFNKLLKAGRLNEYPSI